MIVLANLFAKKIKQTGEKLAYFRKKHKKIINFAKHDNVILSARFNSY